MSEEILKDKFTKENIENLEELLNDSSWLGEFVYSDFQNIIDEEYDTYLAGYPDSNDPYQPAELPCRYYVIKKNISFEDFYEILNFIGENSKNTQELKKTLWSLDLSQEQLDYLI